MSMNMQLSNLPIPDSCAVNIATSITDLVSDVDWWKREEDNDAYHTHTHMDHI